MRFSTVGSIAACAATAAAFKDTSPFFLFSTAESHKSLDVPSTQQIQSRDQVMKSTEGFLKGCPTDAYMIVEQPHVSASDFSSSRAASGLRKALTASNVKHSQNVAEVVDGISADELASYLQKVCGGNAVDVSPDSKTQLPEHPVLKVRLTEPSSHVTASERADVLDSNDAYFATILATLPTSYTVIYTTTPSTEVIHHAPAYEPSFQEPLHVEMKRQSGFAKRANSTVSKNAPLFEKYQFFTPGLFMGIVVALVLLSILSVALRAISGLTVSYGAFDKEMGPAAQRKQQ